MDIAEGLKRCLQLFQNARLKEAEAECRALLASFPGDPNVLNLLGMVFHRSGQSAAAERVLREALGRSPDHPGLQMNLANVLLAAGRIDEAIDGFRRVLALKPDFVDGHFNLGRALEAAGRESDAAEHYRQAARLAPGRPDIAYRHGALAYRAGRLEEADGLLRACADKHGHAELRALLGAVLVDLGRPGEAVEQYRRALLQNPRHPDSLRGYGAALRAAGRLGDALAACEAALREQPDSAECLANLANLQRDLGFIDAALESHHCARAISPDDPRIRFGEALTLLLAGRLAEGFEGYEARWEGSLQMLGRRRRFAAPPWRGESLAGRTVLLHCEQGFGDAIQFVRYAPLVKQLAATVVVECPPQLARLFATVPGIDRLASDGSQEKVDLHCPLLSLPRIFGTELDSVPWNGPYLSAASADEPALPDLSGSLRVGIVWRGGPLSGAGAQRDCPLELLAPVLRTPGVHFRSLQVGASAEETALLSACGVADAAPALSDFADTARVITELDLLISVDTAVAHLAGAMGLPVWLLNRYNSDWRWLLGRDDSPWYPSLRQFRQSDPGDWQGVVTRIGRALGEVQAGRQRVGPSQPPRVRDVEQPVPQPRVLADFADEPVGQRQCRHGPMHFFRHDRYVGRSLQLYGEFSEGEAELFASLLRPGDVVVEAGANIGAHTVELGRRVGPGGSVLAFEPQREVFELLCRNLRDNGLPQVDARCAAVGEAIGEIRVPPVDYRRSGNVGGVSLGGAEGHSVPVVSVDSLALSALRLLKADVEGMEIAVLRGATDTVRRLRPILYVENDRRESSVALITLIRSLGYRIWWHLPPLFNPANYAGIRHNIFGNTISINLLCVPAESAADISGLREVADPGEWYR